LLTAAKASHNDMSSSSSSGMLKNRSSSPLSRFIFTNQTPSSTNTTTTTTTTATTPTTTIATSSSSAKSHLHIPKKIIITSPYKYPFANITSTNSDGIACNDPQNRNNHINDDDHDVGHIDNENIRGRHQEKHYADDHPTTYDITKTKSIIDNMNIDMKNNNNHNNDDVSKDDVTVK